MDNNSINLIKYQIDPSSVYWDATSCMFPIQIEAKNGTGDLADNGVFVMQIANLGYDPNQGDLFVRIANALDIQELPTLDSLESVNTSDLQTPFYRTNKINFFVESVEEANHVWDVTKLDVKNLVTTLNLMNAVEENDEEIIKSNFSTESYQI